MIWGNAGGPGSFHFVEESGRFPRNDRVSTIYGDKLSVDDTSCDSAELPIDSTKQALFTYGLTIRNASGGQEVAGSNPVSPTTYGNECCKNAEICSSK